MRTFVPAIALLLVTSPALASEGAAAGGSTERVAFYLAVILVFAKLGGDLAKRIGQPAVLGELIAGVLLGNVGLIGIPGLDAIKRDTSIDLLSELGVLVLLFEVGLESTIAQMRRVGWSSLLVAVLGVLAPFGLGWLVSSLLLPSASYYAHAFIGATLSATSVGITARVLKDLGQSHSDEARVILGAAVIDDVLGLVILAAVSGIIVAADKGGAPSLASIGWIVGKATGFLVGALVVGIAAARPLFHLAARLRPKGVLLAFGLSFCFAFSALAGAAGLAPIVGAFAAGLVLEDAIYSEFVKRGEQPLDQLVAPISSFLVPIFFVLMGMRTDVRSFAHLNVLGMAAALILAAIAGKQVCSLGVLSRSIDRWSVGIGMIPRGEVGLIFANIGLRLSIGGKPVIDQATFSAVVVMVIVTTMITPPALKWSLGRKRRTS